MIQDRTSLLPKAFIELTLGLSDVLKVALLTFYQVYEIFGCEDMVMVSVIFLSSLVLKKL